MAKRILFNSVILESPFTSIENSAKIYYPYLPIKLLLKDRYDSISKIKTINSPILIMHGEKDDIVPFQWEKNYLNKLMILNILILHKTTDDHMMEFNSKLINVLKNFIEKY